MELAESPYETHAKGARAIGMPELTTECSRLVDLFRLHSVEEKLCEGDTLVLIDYPTHGRKRVDCHGVGYVSLKFRVHAEKLRAASPRFADMLGPTSQFRVQRLRRMVNRLPDGVDYVLDLTPASEGDELVFQMTRLSLTPGLIKWWAAHRVHGVENWLVTGHDDVCACKHSSKPDSSSELPDFIRKIPDYCPIRHRNSIVRLLIIIEGGDVMLDSAHRVWSLVAAADIFDCAPVVRDQVAQWIMHGHNTRFIEVLPEEALRIGFDLELVQVTQCAFRILVNELAIKEAATSPLEETRTTIFGRRLGDLDDELSNIVQHAARALVDRMSSLLADLRNLDLLKLQLGEEWAAVQEMEKVLAEEDHPECVSALADLRTIMRSITFSASAALDQIPAGGTSVSQRLYLVMDHDRATYVEEDDFRPLQDIMQDLDVVQRLMCPFIYQEVEALWSPRLIKHTTARPGEPRVPYTDLVETVTDSVIEFVLSKAGKEWPVRWDVFFEDGVLKTPLINLDKLGRELEQALEPMLYSWLRGDVEPALNITRHLLLNLTGEEMKFLPLWAGGCDDGTGGVFETQIPPAHPTAGVMEPRERVVSGSTVVGSMDAQDGISTVYAPHHVIPETSSIASTFSTNEDEYYLARLETLSDVDSWTVTDLADEEEGIMSDCEGSLVLV